MSKRNRKSRPAKVVTTMVGNSTPIYQYQKHHS